MNILKRNSTTINVATFWENYQLGKYNFDPPYHTILKNFPMPPIFLHQHIDAHSGKTMYDIIDGKQRLTAIINFLKNAIPTPEDFNVDEFGDDRLAGIHFKDLEKHEIAEWKKVLWRYEISIEYIDTDQRDIVTNIFDRLNRNGEPLTRQELRNAKYHSTELYQLIKRLSELSEFDAVFEKIQTNRFEHHEIVSELLFAQMENEVLPGDNNLIDDLYAKYADNKSFIDGVKSIEMEFIKITEIFRDFQIDYTKHKVQGLSHFYALWFLALIIHRKKIALNNLPMTLDNFYSNLKIGVLLPELMNYKASMSSNTKSKSSRTKRINALLQYAKLEVM
jgi:hypothetical protein